MRSGQPSIQSVDKTSRLAAYMLNKTVVGLSDDRPHGGGITLTMSDGEVIKITAQHDDGRTMLLSCYESLTTAEEPGTISLRKAINNEQQAFVFRYPELCTTTTEQVNTFISWINSLGEIPYTLTWKQRRKKPGIKLFFDKSYIKLNPGDYVVVRPTWPRLNIFGFYAMSPEAFAERYTLVGQPRTPTP